MNIIGRTLIAALLGTALATTVQARVTRIVIDETIPFTPPWMGPTAPPIPYEKVAGRAFGELDPALPVNAIIQDINLARDKDGIPKTAIKVMWQETEVVS